MRLLSRKSSCSVLSIALAAGLPLGTGAQAQTGMTLPEVTVEGATLEAKRPPARAASAAGQAAIAPGGAAEPADAHNAGVPAYTIGNAVTVITGEELRAQQVRNAADALRGMPGVAVGRSGGFGSLTQVRIRGAEGNHTLVLIDGVEANSTMEGEFDFSMLSAEEIDRIEVIRGPMSALYGSSAVGGVINITTRRGNGPLTATIRSEVGSLASSDHALRLAAGNRWGNFSFGANLRDTDGFNIAPVGNEKDGLLLRSFSFRGGLQLGENLSLNATLRQSTTWADRDGDGGPPGTLTTAVDELSTLRNKFLLAGVQVQWDTFDKTLTHQFRANHNSTTIADKSMLFPAFPFFTENSGERTTYGYLATYRFDGPAALRAKNTISGLIETEQEDFVPRGTTGDGLARERDRLSFAGEFRSSLADQFFITAGLRRDNNSVFEDFTTWRLAGAWALKPWGLRPHASAGTAVKFPAMFEQFGDFPGFFIANPNLTPEESFGWDAGVEFTLGRATTLDVTYFRANLQNKISQSGLGSPNPTLINLPGTSKREGVEFALRTRLMPALMATVAYTYLDATEPDGVQEIRRPPHAGRVDLAYTFAGGRGTANLGVLYNGAQTDIRFINDPILGFPVPTTRGGLDSYWVVNAALSYQLEPGLEVFGRVENLLDQRYQEIFGYQAAPITAFAGIKVTLGGKDGYGGGWVK
jgi:vitamin B12 transporter